MTEIDFEKILSHLEYVQQNLENGDIVHASYHIGKLHSYIKATVKKDEKPETSEKCSLEQC